MLLTDEEKRALEGTLLLKGVDDYRQAILTGKLPQLIFLINAVLHHHATTNSRKAKDFSEIASAVALGNVFDLKDQPLALSSLNELSKYAMILPIPES